MTSASLSTPVGEIHLHEDNGKLVRVTWDTSGLPTVRDTPLLATALDEVQAYFEGRLTRFSVPLALGPSEFQARFQRALLDIPFGETRTYGDLASDLGVSAQTIGQACGANRLPVIVPCHRVLGASGLGGFSGGVGVETKVQLLRHEGAAGLLI
ncbi:methylated-DNA--[protein]-cysteine S-methyltransferase [Shimia ponticola]|uniref:methylated-DNA--[protein]-cysteine S-methyltransferase n=1 Tax=Shimia ponticola TaxID=2582893 RepID=UPI0011BF249B|nr:methylated-DNA--[protein]-cysteine S-methyltransferase [Shimia ponticola]